MVMDDDYLRNLEAGVEELREKLSDAEARLKLAEEVCEVFRHYHLSDGDDSAVTYEDIVDRMLAWERVRDKAKGSG
jgi:hypothetical protein